MRELIRNEIDEYSREFKGFEAVHDFVLAAEEFTTQNDMLTPTLKIKRRNVLKPTASSSKRSTSEDVLAS